MSTAVSPLAPTDVPAMPEIAGVKLATAAAGIRYKGRTDVLLAVLDKGTTVGGVFTKSKCPSAPVEWCRAKLKRGKARALVVNSGNANAFTGKTGKQSTALTAQIAAKAVGCSVNDEAFFNKTLSQISGGLRLILDEQYLHCDLNPLSLRLFDTDRCTWRSERMKQVSNRE